MVHFAFTVPLKCINETNVRFASKRPPICSEQECLIILSKEVIRAHYRLITRTNEAFSITSFYPKNNFFKITVEKHNKIFLWQKASSFYNFSAKHSSIKPCQQRMDLKFRWNHTIGGAVNKEVFGRQFCLRSLFLKNPLQPNRKAATRENESNSEVGHQYIFGKSPILQELASDEKRRLNKKSGHGLG